MSEPDGSPRWRRPSSPRGAALLASLALLAAPASRAQEQPVLSVADIALAEGDGSTTTFTFVVSLTPRTDRVVTVDYETRDDSASVAAGDYVAAAGTLTLPPGTDSAAIDVLVNGDLVEEPDEVFHLVLSNPTHARLGDAVAAGVILDDDGPAPPGEGPQLDIGDAVVAEGDGGRVQAVFTLTLSTTSRQPVSVDFATADGSATTGEDYVETAGQILFPPGTTTRQLQVAVLGDVEDEGDEDFLVELSAPVNATLGTAVGVGVIEDDDGPGGASLEALGSPGRTGRPGEMVVLQVRLRSAGGEPVRGTLVQWGLDGDGELLDGATTATDENGRAAQRVRLGDNPGHLAVRAEHPGSHSAVVYQITVGSRP
ncbi:MAG TPA: Calx-beta domain-containing protein [Thermoanaerobaculia bacterium]|nr:Calx-beta domain-containing protein [Thermoanaerobaculia bacterium]